MIQRAQEHDHYPESAMVERVFVGSWAVPAAEESEACCGVCALRVALVEKRARGWFWAYLLAQVSAVVFLGLFLWSLTWER